MPFETAIFQWEEGERRLREAPAPQRALLERVTDAIVGELRRRLGGGRFTTDELTELYGRDTDWCLEIAMARAPGRPDAWDSQTVVDAAFARYVREAVDYAGGRRLVRDE